MMLGSDVSRSCKVNARLSLNDVLGAYIKPYQAGGCGRGRERYTYDSAILVFLE